jgi:hypothetical protein
VAGTNWSVDRSADDDGDDDEGDEDDADDEGVTLVVGLVSLEGSAGSSQTGQR